MHGGRSASSSKRVREIQTRSGGQTPQPKSARSGRLFTRATARTNASAKADGRSLERQQAHGPGHPGFVSTINRACLPLFNSRARVGRDACRSFDEANFCRRGQINRNRPMPMARETSSRWRPTPFRFATALPAVIAVTMRWEVERVDLNPLEHFQ